ncbi:unnamed protein product [Callosobruchus maculatus]|uniref:Borealin C-terminal domain-containing protein n=1 Tax=Callosobruchus maculatus TaxID=64391 RepID=A0A653CUC8_CALMS|nr:unnamed protein product [Callosobruchus maculatus]
MPRTKVNRKKLVLKKEPGDTENASRGRIRKELLERYQQKDVENINEYYDSLILKIEENCMQRILKISEKHRKMTMEEIGNLASFNTTTAPSMMDGSSASTNIKRTVRRSVSCNDDGYMTCDSAASADVRRSRSRAKKTVTASARPARSLSRNAANNRLGKLGNGKTAANHSTPMNQATRSDVGLITPKCNIKQPQLILRRPRGGEVAFSQEGSPLMPGAYVGDNVVNLNIPLDDGRVISLLPEMGTIRESIIPEFEPETLKQLERLRMNLEKMCRAGSSKKQ